MRPFIKAVIYIKSVITKMTKAAVVYFENPNNTAVFLMFLKIINELKKLL
ncbi:hypothetical protein N475_05830 [Pseudoalteromonas luteoviolacea DSM 6061]|uniref:Transposase DDE domain-containing protein n=1 Tax=Pseudoalteromonas luteoviolacea DSM 6061 TaxID=1365250 RepID=A0A166UD23_9GAMM|nr:hypothetical protein N475_05830 [Pseudoalteromonas luteoviolacea DSM 6061]MBE0389275.1 hypothetical protein [Pseudoalteromonas luteoviolacea DSM 6061]